MTCIYSIIIHAKQYFSFKNLDTFIYESWFKFVSNIQKTKIYIKLKITFKSERNESLNSSP